MRKEELNLKTEVSLRIKYFSFAPDKFKSAIITSGAVNFHPPFSEPPSFFFFFLIPQILK